MSDDEFSDQSGPPRIEKTPRATPHLKEVGFCDGLAH